MTELMRKNTGEVLQVVNQVLTPYLGRLMAGTAAVAHCRDLGIDGAVMEPRQLEQLLEKLHLGLTIFLGKEKTALVVSAIRQEVSTLQEVSH
jgi:hypothetical protein